MHRGYTKRWRKRWDKGYHQDTLMWIMMDYLIDFASWKDNEFPFMWKGKLVEMVTVKRGQCFFTIQSLAEFLTGPKNRVSRDMIRSRLKILEKLNFLSRHESRKYQLVTITNYDTYNPLEDSEPHPTQQNPRTKLTSMPHQSHTSNNYKKVKKGKKKPFSPPTVDQVIDYFKENGYTVASARKAHKFYATANWHDSQEKPVKNWKQKMIAVWFKPENEAAQGGNQQPRPPNHLQNAAVIHLREGPAAAILYCQANGVHFDEAEHLAKLINKG